MTLSRFRNGFYLALLLLVVAAGASAAQAPSGLHDTSAASVASYAPSHQMPVDPEVLVGTLPNGLRSYVRANAKPAHRAELRLVVKAGSVLEDDDQQGLAHFVEHMEFEGTRHFPKQGLVDFLSLLGLGIGPDANAETSYDDTQYTLRVPTDQRSVLDRALLVLEDWAHGATFDQSGIDRERGIVLSEWRLHLDADQRTKDKVIGAQLAGSRYADRAPIGKPDIIEHAQREQLMRFYRDWYRPDGYALDAAAGVARNPTGPASSDDPGERGVPKRVQRGGSFLCSGAFCTRYLVGARGRGDAGRRPDRRRFPRLAGRAAWPSAHVRFG